MIANLISILCPVFKSSFVKFYRSRQVFLGPLLNLYGEFGIFPVSAFNLLIVGWYSCNVNQQCRGLSESVSVTLTPHHTTPPPPPPKKQKKKTQKRKLSTSQDFLLMSNVMVSTFNLSFSCCLTSIDRILYCFFSFLSALVSSVCSIYLTRTLFTCIQIMDYGSLPHFCRREGSGSSKHYRNEGTDNCFSLDHAFHQQLYNYINQQALSKESTSPIKQGSMHVDFPEPNPADTEIMKTIQTEFNKLGNMNGLANSLKGVKVNGD